MPTCSGTSLPLINFVSYRFPSAINKYQEKLGIKHHKESCSLNFSIFSTPVSRKSTYHPHVFV
jgi:hypothetical protein